MREEANQDMFAPPSILPTDEQLTPAMQAFVRGQMPVSSLTLKELFVGLAMMGHCANPANVEKGYDELALDSLRQAEAQIEEIVLAETKP